MTLLISGTDILLWLLWFLLFASMIVLIAVILLQEGKGGGLAEAFGGVGAETFGVKAHGINKFTAIVGSLFLLLCVMLVKIHSGPDTTPLVEGFEPKKPGANAPLVPGTRPGGTQTPAPNGKPAGGGTPPPDKPDGK